MTIDGSMYRYLGNGEYYLFVVPELSFEVQIRMISCYSSGSCVNAVAVNASGSVVLIHGRYSITEEPVVYINGRRSLDLVADVGSKNEQGKLLLQRISYLRYELSNRFGVSLSIRLYDRYMDITIDVKNTSYCLNSIGLIGNCNGNHFDDFNSNNRLSVTHSNITQDYIYEVFGPSWKVSNANSLFEYNLNSYQELRHLHGGGYALYFNNTGIHTNDIYSFSASDISIELMVKLVESDGVILSYSTSETFALTVQSKKLFLQYADNILDTYIILDLNKYYQMAIIWARDYQIIQLYFIEADGTLHSRNFPTKSNVFQPGGVLALGYWTPSPSGLGRPPTKRFVGEVDEMRLWNKKLSMSDASSNWKRNLDCKKIPGLVNLWKFNEGQGNRAHDCISDVDFKIPETNWHSVRWVYSHADIPLFSKNPIEAHLLLFRPSKEYEKAESKCTQIFYTVDLMRNCAFLSNVTIMYYHALCISTVLHTGAEDSAYWIVMNLADICSPKSLNTSWPASSFCKDVDRLNFPDWVGPSCSEYCRYGLRSIKEIDSCDCVNGFYGKMCSEQCPGGHLTPCNGFSDSCGLSGECQCPLTANISRDCSKCKNGWMLKDCSVALVNNSVNEIKYCQGFGSGYYATFDGVHYKFNMYGENYIINTPQLSVQARQIPCGEAFCITSIAVKTTGKYFTIRASFNKTNKSLLWINGRRTVVTRAVLDSEYTYRKVSPNTFEITNNLTSSSANSLKVKTYGKFLTFELTLSKNLCLKGSGLCSSCDNNPKNDFSNSANSNIMLNQANISMVTSVLSERWNVPTQHSLFIFNTTSYHEQRQITLSGFCLSFDGTVAYTDSLVGAFQDNKDFTIQVCEHAFLF